MANLLAKYETLFNARRDKAIAAQLEAGEMQIILNTGPAGNVLWQNSKPFTLTKRIERKEGEELEHISVKLDTQYRYESDPTTDADIMYFDGDLPY